MKTLILLASASFALGEPADQFVAQVEVHLTTCRDIMLDDPRGGVERWAQELGRRMGEDTLVAGAGAAEVAYRREATAVCYAYWTGRAER